MAAVMNMQAPHRKPIPSHGPPAQYMQSQQAPQAYSNGPVPRSPSYAMSGQQQQQYPSRRTLSNATSSTSSTQNAPTRQGTGNAPASSYASSIRRSTSSRSTSTTSPTSYVALMRKQKATVWCDRAQHEDPRILAAQRQAKMRATMEVAGAHHSTANGRTSTSSSGIAGGVRSKIRHHGAVKASTYNAANLSGAGVPMRLSATEVDEGDSGEEDAGQNRYHQRNGSGRSSMGSATRHPQSSHSNSLLSRGGYPVSTATSSPTSPEDQTPMPQHSSTQSSDYFAQPGGSGGSGSSGEAEKSFGGAGALPVQTRARGDTAVRKTSEELRRRGSVDDRTMTMSAGRLFVANPDAEDTGCSAVSLLLVCQIINFEASPFLYKAVTADIEFIHPSMEFIQTLQFSFAQLRHAHRIRNARITFHTDDRVGTVGSSEYLDSITTTLVSLQYGALFEQIHIIVRTCCITRSGGAVIEAAFEAFSKIKCPGRVTIEWDSARLGSGTFVLRMQAEQLRAKFATLLETLKAVRRLQSAAMG
nr:hypothetical protein B0A51_03935 [Rachicladosporium sp. CCFEE 5018]